MPFYEMIMLCKVGESSAMGTLVKNVTSAILQEGGKYFTFILNKFSTCWLLGVVRGIENLGDRVISKNLKAQDGNKYGVARYISVLPPLLLYL